MLPKRRSTPSGFKTLDIKIQPFNAVMISDLHFTHHLKDEYRWKVWDQIEVIRKEKSIKDLLILGDILDRKDKHPAELVNRLVSELVKASNNFRQVIVLMGNHDYLKQEHPFLDFIDHISDNLVWINKPTLIDNTLWCPSTKNPKQDWAELPFSTMDFVFLHQPFIGSFSALGYEIPVHNGRDCFPEADMSKVKKFWSGDIHMPQRVAVGEIEINYVGTPYPIIQGDEYDCRAILLTGDDDSIIPLENIRKPKLVINTLQELEDAVENKVIRPGDQAQIRFLMEPEDASDWPVTRQKILDFATENNLTINDVKGELTHMIDKDKSKLINIDQITDQEALEQFVKQEHIDEFTYEMGKKIIAG